MTFLKSRVSKKKFLSNLTLVDVRDYTLMLTIYTEPKIQTPLRKKYNMTTEFTSFVENLGFGVKAKKMRPNTSSVHVMWTTRVDRAY